MKRAILLGSVVTLSLFLTAAARAGPLWRERLDQAPVLTSPNFAMPPTQDASTGVILSDVIGKDRIINIFSGFTRDIDTVSARLDDGSKNATILAPENSAIHNLPRKPWEDPKDYEQLGADAYGGSDGPDRASKNLEKFVNAHIIPESPWHEGHKIKTLAGNVVWYEVKDGKKVIQPGDIEVSSVADKVGNGELWIIKGVLNYA
ncbi:uncharacterized protein K452DRAFT_218504 [Aplosporella prunicola CBS 121167]|uniref:FAS1 domain-containing protein n=1 Tax=Aplosporella prunicola CBS 121167 TaxID=1176127 RepID=A0A6A6BS31_9PEZI|nr:uncharacterized protein K452DRAFT_218504 [Aplosporella prunicola CBS 121167]KAF2146810.1 hypothetical protein K452DRAFT_218504 [Aplosporella prunicola CBS 121167]